MCNLPMKGSETKTETPSFIKIKENSVYFSVFVKPNSKKNEVLIDIDNDEMKIFTTSPSIKGKANKTVLKLMADFLDLPSSYLKLISGHKSKIKTVRMDFLDVEEKNRILEKMIKN